MRRLNITATAAATAVAAVLGVTALSGCGAVEKALDCAHTALIVAQTVEDLGRVMNEGGQNPEEAAEALNRIDRNLDKIGDRSDNTDVGNAVEDMRQAVDNARTAVEKGEIPNISPIGDAADELTNVCSAG